MNIHFHTLVLDGVFTESAAGELRFHPALPPTDEEVAQLLATLRRRVGRLLKRRGLECAEEGIGLADPVAEESLVLAEITSASVQGRVALGPRAGGRVLRLGYEPEDAEVGSRGPRQAHLDGFDLHANLAVPAPDRVRLEGLCRYLLRPPISEDRLRLMDDGRVLVTLKTAWADGTSHLLMEPIELLEKLAAVTPRPRINLVLYHGLLAPNSRWRERVVAYRGADPSDSPALEAGASAAEGRAEADGEHRYWTWAALMRRAFDQPIDYTSYH